jgi:hypothetical protein
MGIDSERRLRELELEASESVRMEEEMKLRVEYDERATRMQQHRLQYDHDSKELNERLQRLDLLIREADDARHIPTTANLTSAVNSVGLPITPATNRVPVSSAAAATATAPRGVRTSLSSQISGGIATTASRAHHHFDARTNSNRPTISSEPTTPPAPHYDHSVPPPTITTTRATVATATATAPWSSGSGNQSSSHSTPAYASSMSSLSPVTSMNLNDMPPSVPSMPPLPTNDHANSPTNIINHIETDPSITSRKGTGGAARQANVGSGQYIASGSTISPFYQHAHAPALASNVAAISGSGNHSSADDIDSDTGWPDATTSTSTQQQLTRPRHGDDRALSQQRAPMSSLTFGYPLPNVTTQSQSRASQQHHDDIESAYARLQALAASI